ncbi:MAG: hypothetical protein K6357_05345 [Elusimicrobiota bacterium]
MKKVFLFSMIALLFTTSVVSEDKVFKVEVDMYFEPFDTAGWQNYLNFDLIKRKIKDIKINVYPIILKEKDKLTNSRGEIETSEVARIEGIIKKYPLKLNDYLISRSLNMTPDGWRDALIFTQINPVEFDEYVQKNRSLLIKEAYDRISSKNIVSMSIFVNGNPYNKSARMLDIIETINSNLPQEKKIKTYKDELLKIKGPKFKVVYSKESEGWIDERIIEAFKRFFSSLDVEKVEFQTLSPKEKEGIKMLPAYLIEKNQTVNEVLSGPIEQNAFEKLGNYYAYYNPNSSNIILNRKKEGNKLELFVMSQCPFGVMAENSIINAVEKGLISKDITIEIHYIGDYFKDNEGKINFNSLHGELEWQEDARQLIIKKLFPEKFFAYLKERNKNYQSGEWKEAAQKSGIDIKTIESNFDSLGKKLLEEDFKYSNSLKMTVSPSFIVNGNISVVGINQLKSFEAYKDISIETSSAGGGCGK